MINSGGRRGGQVAQSLLGKATTKLQPQSSSPTFHHLVPIDPANSLQPLQAPSFPDSTFDMSGRQGGGGGTRKVLLPPINFIFKLLQTHATVQIWLYEQVAIRIEGKIRVR